MGRRRSPRPGRTDDEWRSRWRTDRGSGDESRSRAEACSPAVHDAGACRAFVHAIRNPLNGARLHAVFLQRKLEGSCAEDDVIDAVNHIIQEIDAAARLAEELEDSGSTERPALRHTKSVQQAAHDAPDERRKDGKYDDHVPEDERCHAEACSGRR